MNKIQWVKVTGIQWNIILHYFVQQLQYSIINIYNVIYFKVFLNKKIYYFKASTYDIIQTTNKTSDFE